MSDDIVPASRIIKIKRALISVSDKDGIIELAQALHDHGTELLSTGGTSKLIAEAGIPVKDVSDHTGSPEIMDGRVKTLHPKIHGGILAVRDNKEHQRAMSENDITDIDMVVVNLYPFAQTVASGADFQTCIENIDIGGPAMIRSAAKNHNDVVILTDPQDYEAVLNDMKEHDGGVTCATRKRLAANAYSLTAAYDSNISNWFAAQQGESFPRRISFSGNLKQTLRYGENPHQNAALYTIDNDNRPGVSSATQLQGKELSYNNINDTNAAFELVAEFEDPTLAIIKHANPCGVASDESMLEAYKKARLCDPVSAFGGIIALNRPVTAELAGEITKSFVEVIIAPSVDEDALPHLAKKDKIRVLTTGDMPGKSEKRRMVTRVAGGLLVQDADTGHITPDDLKVVTERAPTEQELKDLLFAFRISKHVKSNTITYVKDGATVGVGAGQMSRVDAARIAAWKAAEAAKEAGLSEPLTKGSVVASDAFFPFADGLISAAEAGVTAVIQPGGSIRDDEVIAAANERGLAMVFTGMRHFRH